MDLHITHLPLWVNLSFGIFFVIVPPYLIANAAKQALSNASRPDPNKIRNLILFFFLVYFMAIGITSLGGFFVTNSLPPKIIVVAALPLMLFYLIIVQRKIWFKYALKSIELEQLVYVHIFRLVGVYFLIANSYGALPDNFALIGGVGDILTAILTLPVLYYLRKKASFSISLVWMWNVFGLIDILSVLVTALIVTREAILNSESGIIQFGTFPFSWIPAFAPATIIFLHILIFKKLIRRKLATTNNKLNEPTEL